MILLAATMRPSGRHCEVVDIPVRLILGVESRRDCIDEWKYATTVDADPLGSHHLPLLAGAGFLVGGTVGIMRSSKTPVLWTIATTIQWGLLGGSYWGMQPAFISSMC